MANTYAYHMSNVPYSDIRPIVKDKIVGELLINYVEDYSVGKKLIVSE